MNIKLLLLLSLFGLAMGIATVYVIPSNVEPFLWFAIFCISAFVIAKNCSGKYFLHGFVLSLFNCVWITSAHVLLFSTYLANHPKEAAMMTSMPLPMHPRLMMLMMGPIVGIVCGIVVGLFSFIASKLVKK